MFCDHRDAVGSPSRLPAFCLSEAVLGSEHKCRWLTSSEEEGNSPSEEQVRVSSQDDDLAGEQMDNWANKRYSDHE